MKIFFISLILCSSSIFASPLMKPFVDSEMQREKRIALLKEHFSPPIGEEVIFIRPKDKGFRVRHLAQKYRGEIIVTPPKGHCFIIQRFENQRDDFICERKKIPVTVKDLHFDGSIRWIVKTGKGDYGTNISWKTPHRIGKVVDLDMEWPGPSRYVYIHNCVAINSQQLGRQAILNLMNEQRIVIHFPDKDQLLPQPSARSNLPVHNIKKKVGLDAKSQLAKRQKRKKLMSLAGTGITKEGRLAWQITPRNAYYMDSANLLAETSNPRGAIGKCWYKFKGERFDPESGILECHGTADYKWVYLPLTCINQLRPAYN